MLGERWEVGLRHHLDGGDSGLVWDLCPNLWKAPASQRTKKKPRQGGTEGAGGQSCSVYPGATGSKA